MKAVSAANFIPIAPETFCIRLEPTTYTTINTIAKVSSLFSLFFPPCILADQTFLLIDSMVIVYHIDLMMTMFHKVKYKKSM